MKSTKRQHAKKIKKLIDHYKKERPSIAKRLVPPMEKALEELEAQIRAGRGNEDWDVL
jgi:plasmid stabilization system protein ParE